MDQVDQASSQAQVMDQTQTAAVDVEEVDDEHGKTSIEILVNKKPVTLSERTVTGSQIKAAAISQGVAIQQDFLLYIVRGNGQLDPVADSETIHVHPHEQFRAVTPDDVSEA